MGHTYEGDIHIDGHIWKDIHTNRYTHSGIYTRWDIHMNGRVECTQDRVCKGWSIHRVECTQCGMYTGWSIYRVECTVENEVILQLKLLRTS